MDALDVITLQQAKQYTRVDFPDDDILIESIIAAAVNYVEQLTNYRLYNRIETKHSDGTYNVDIFQTPIVSIKVQTLDGTYITWPQIKVQPVRRTVIFERSSYNNAWASTHGFGDGLDNGVGYFYNWGASLPLFNIVIDCGYTNTADIPFDILQAVKTIIVNMYENRDVSTETIPSSVTDMLMSYSRNPMF